MPEPSNRSGRRIDEIRAGAPAPAQGAIDMMVLTSRTADLFLIQPPHEKQHSSDWFTSRRHGELQTQFEEPFENLRRSNQLAEGKIARLVRELPETKVGSPAWIRTTNLTGFGSSVTY